MTVDQTAMQENTTDYVAGKYQVSIDHWPSKINLIDIQILFKTFPDLTTSEMNHCVLQVQFIDALHQN